MQRIENIFLVGPMGVGKSTIGKQLAAKIGLEFRDSDFEIQKRTGVDIPTIFEFEGEAGFRKREQAILDELTQQRGVVLSTGGGVILDATSRQHLTARGVVFYLHCSPEQQFARTQKDRSRPLLQTENPLAKLQELMAQRDPLYRQVADYIISTEKRNAAAVTKDIIQQLSEG
ncbi:MAG: shikimate kinase AroK [Candidatus Polarisedimenticolaceae bacterium]|nr:shikimate kinase AroK [Candidatus Polarisedimenticolaceae bacterium]